MSNEAKILSKNKVVREVINNLMRKANAKSKRESYVMQ